MTTVIFEYNGKSKEIPINEIKSVNDVADLLGGKRIHRDPVIEPKVTRADNGKASFLLNWKPTQNFEEWVIKWKEGLGL